MIVLGDRLFRRQDERARSAGWEVDRSHMGLGRRYRDPRIARRARPAPAPVDDVERRPALVGVSGGWA